MKAPKKPAPPRLRTVVEESDVERIEALVAAGASYSGAAASVGLRPSALRLAKQSNPELARRLRAAWRRSTAQQQAPGEAPQATAQNGGKRCGCARNYGGDGAPAFHERPKAARLKASEQEDGINPAKPGPRTAFPNTSRA